MKESLYLKAGSPKHCQACGKPFEHFCIRGGGNRYYCSKGCAGVEHVEAAVAEPEDWIKDLLKESLYLRGRIVASYSQVEFLLADLSVKLNLKFPYRISDRIKAAKKIGEQEQLAKYKAELDSVCDELLRFDDLRNMMSHAFMTMHVDKQKNHQFDYKMYRRDGGVDFILLNGRTEIDRLRAGAEDLTKLTERAMNLFKRIYEEQSVEKKPA